MDDKWGGHKPAAMRLAPAESGAGAGPLPARCWHGGGSDGSAGAGPLHSQFALSPPVRCRLRRGWPQLPEPARWWAASAMLSGTAMNPHLQRRRCPDLNLAQVSCCFFCARKKKKQQVLNRHRRWLFCYVVDTVCCTAYSPKLVK